MALTRLSLCIIPIAEMAGKGGHREELLLGKCDMGLGQAGCMPEPFLKTALALVHLVHPRPVCLDRLCLSELKQETDGQENIA